MRTSVSWGEEDVSGMVDSVVSFGLSRDWMRILSAGCRIEERRVGATAFLYTGAVMSCLFCKIIDGSIPSTAVYQDDKCYAFADLHPQAPVHLLIAPREHLVSLAEAGEEHPALLGHLLWVAANLARKNGLAKGYRVVINTGEEGGQTVDHLHVHLVGGRAMGWPPG